MFNYIDMGSTAYFVSIDVGTGSVRAALVAENGKILKTFVHVIKTWNLQPTYYEQSSNNIWESVIKCVRGVTNTVDSAAIKGIGFAATCSLVCVDRNGDPLTVNLSGNNDQNVILWMDHRATKETELINSFHHPILKYVGGKMFPEMQTPKLLWLKNNLTTTWKNVGYFFDLPDFLTWRATNIDSRSSCSVVCKWTYEMNIQGTEAWNRSFFEQIGISDLAKDNWKKIGSCIQNPGESVGKGLTQKAAEELGLRPGTIVGTSMIDAHAGGLGLIGCQADNIDSNFETRVGLICGTSTCHMAVSREAIFVPGIWGPYKSAMIAEMWLNEGGQSATGRLLDHIVDTHPASIGIKKKLQERHITQYLNEVLYKFGLKNPDFLTKGIHVYPDFHGNRLLGDSTLKGMITGLTLANDEENLAIIYLAAVQAICYGTRQILDRLKDSGYKKIKSTLICGGLSKNSIFTAAQANICNLPVICPNEIDSVLLGGAILGAVASKHFSSLDNAIKSMAGKGKVVCPDSDTTDYHNKKYKIYLEMYKDQVKYKKIME